jgi:hypothetical protein
MAYLHSTLFGLHIVFGSLSLILFWVPFFTKKGKLNHKRFGRHYKNAMYIVAGSGALMSLFVLAFPMTIKGEIISAASNPEKMTTSFRLFWSFLLYLSLLSFTVTRHSVAVIRMKENRESLRKPFYLLPIVALVLGAPVLLYFGYLHSMMLLIVFAVLGVFVGLTMLHYCLRSKIAERQWVLEHISSFVGSGIGAYTAFIAFGGRALFSDLGSWQIVFWIAPGVVGTIASALLCKRYTYTRAS